MNDERQKSQSTVVDQRPAAGETAIRETATVVGIATPSPSRQRDRDKAKLAETTSRIITLERELSDANARIESLESDVAARQIRETDLAARLLKSERKLREYEQIIARRADERKRGQ